MRLEADQHSDVATRRGATSPNLAQIVRLVCSDLHFRSEKCNGIAGIEVATSHLCRVRGRSGVF